jgi:DNA-binding NarL/FixJ family response regulator
MMTQHTDASSANVAYDDSAGSALELFSCGEMMMACERSQERPRIFVISDIRLLRDGIVLDLSRCESLEVIGAADGTEGLARVAAESPTVVLLDAGVAGGLAVPRRLRQLVPELRIVVFAVAPGETDIVAWAEAGTNGYVAREASSTDLIVAIEGALRGEIFCSARLTGLLLARVAELSGRRGPCESADVLTPRERSVMDLLEHGLSNKEIARRLGIGPATVKNHVHRILGKLQARGRGEAVARLRRSEGLARLASDRITTPEAA